MIAALWYSITRRLMVWIVPKAYHAAKAVGDDHEAQHIMLAMSVSQSEHRNGKCIFDYTRVHNVPPEALALYYWDMNGMVKD